jgi:hypothetical protein
MDRLPALMLVLGLACHSGATPEDQQAAPFSPSAEESAAARREVGTCGRLSDARDERGVMIALDQNTDGLESIEILDPMCEPCRTFDRELSATGLGAQLHRKAVLMPLDNRCNWRVLESFNPGSCTVSEAILCADAGTGATTVAQVVQWAFDEQVAIRDASRNDPDAAVRMVKTRFPELAGCVGSDQVRQRLNQSMRWAVDHEVPVSAPQLWVRGTKLCYENPDIGLAASLGALLDHVKGGA